MRSRILVVSGFVYVVVSSVSALAAIDVSSIGPAGYTQSFDSLTVDSSTTNWQNDSTLPGWSLFRINTGMEPAPVAIQKYELSDGTLDLGRFYSFGTTGDSDRALGAVGKSPFGDGISAPTGVSIPNNSLAGWIAVCFTNDTMTTLNQFSVEFDGEQWRQGGDNEPPVAQTMEFEFGFGSTFSSVTTWTKPGGNFNFTSPVFSVNSGPVDGNSSGMGGGLVADRGGTVTGLNWGAGETLWFRWIEWNDDVFDHGLAIDNFSFMATAVPEPSAALFGGLVAGLSCFAALAKWMVGRLRTRSLAVRTVAR